jgi:ribosomal protein S18 acetylase RimI-like enzyme
MQLLRLTNYNQQELKQIVDLHFLTLQESTFKNFGKKFIKIVYQTIITDKNNIFLVIEDKNRIFGFVAATQDINEFYQSIIRKNFFSLTFEVIRSTLFNPQLLINTTKWILKKPKKQKYPAELQFIAVDSALQGQGWGTKLIKKLNEELKKSNINHYRVGTWASNPLSNNFYQKLGFKLLEKEKILGIDFNYYLSPKVDCN